MVNKSVSGTFEGKRRLLGVFLKELRINYGMTQQDLTNEYNIPRSVIQRIERGDNINVETLFHITSALNIELSQLFQMLDN